MRPVILIICVILQIVPLSQAKSQPMTLASQSVQIASQEAPGGFTKQSHTSQMYVTDTEHIDTRFRAGQYAASQMLQLREQGISVDNEQFVYWQQLAIDNLVRLLNSTPNHRPARLLLSQVYHESEMPERLMALYESQRLHMPNDPEPYFFMCLALQDMGKTRSQSMSIIPEIEGAFSMHDVSNRWLSRDPLFLTEVNERLKTHFCRVIYAEMRFGNAQNNEHGFQTDRGEMYVRYGDPQTRLLRTTNRGTEEIWAYPHFKLTFLKTGNTWHFTKAQTETQSYISPDKFITQQTDQYLDPYRYAKYPIPVQMGQFRAPNGQTRVELFFGLPKEKVEHHQVNNGLARVNILKGIFLFQENGLVQTRNVNHITHMPLLQRNTHEDLLLWTEHVLASPGQHQLTIEAQDQSRSSIGAFNGALTISDFSGDTLQISTPLLAHRIQAHHTRPYGREHFTILANPSGQFGTHDNIATYFETYNLVPDEKGISQVRVRYWVRAIPPNHEEHISSWETIADQTIKHKGNWTTHAYEFRGDWLMPGPKMIQVQVEDLHTGQIVQAQTPFHVRW
jgi:GWxTD domain-containing protein